MKLNRTIIATAMAFGMNSQAYGASQCLPCPLDTYTTVGGQSCTGCPNRSNTTSIGSVSIGDCKCRAGSYMGTNQSGEFECLECPPGSTSQSGSTSYRDCKCPANTYMSGGSGRDNVLECAPCGANKASPAGSTSSAACQSTLPTCSAGQILYNNECCSKSVNASADNSLIQWTCVSSSYGLSSSGYGWNTYHPSKNDGILTNNNISPGWMGASYGGDYGNFCYCRVNNVCGQYRSHWIYVSGTQNTISNDCDATCDTLCKTTGNNQYGKGKWLPRVNTNWAN